MPKCKENITSKCKTENLRAIEGIMNALFGHFNPQVLVLYLVHFYLQHIRGFHSV